MLSEQHGCIFVHIQKTGGQSIRALLSSGPPDSYYHRQARELRAAYGGEAWARCFKFAFVRNPWDRLVSWWTMIDRNRPLLGSGRLNAFQTYVLTRANSFEEFLAYCSDDIADTDGMKCIYRNQFDYLSDESGHLIVDFVGRFERLGKGMAIVASRLGLTMPAMPHLNKSPRGPYVDYYTPAFATLVAERYAPDIAAFGYRFGQPLAQIPTCAGGHP
jgi:hypothetical protein